METDLNGYVINTNVLHNVYLTARMNDEYSFILLNFVLKHKGFRVIDLSR